MVHCNQTAKNQSKLTFFQGMEEKNMKQKTAIWGMLGIGLLVAVVILGAVGKLNMGLFSTTSEEGNVVQPTGGGTVDCNNAPTLNVAVRNAKSLGTAVTTTDEYAVNGVYFGSTAPTFKYGDKVQVLATKASYINVLSPVTTLTCGANSVTLDMFDYAQPTVELKEDSTVIGGAVNASPIVAGGSNTLQVCVTGTDKTSTGDMTFVLELASNTRVSDLNMYDASGSLEKVAVPDFYVDTLTSPYKKAFKIPAIVGAQEKCYSLTIVAKSGQTIDGAAYGTFYVAEPVTDIDGTFLPSAIQDSDGVAAYEATFTSDFAMG
jgi:hypothetical protein